MSTSAGTTHILSFSPSNPRPFPKTLQALSWPLVSHRSPDFQFLYDRTVSRLRMLVGSSDYTVLLTAGNGTLANDLMLSSMATRSHRPLVLINGEFGQRLFNQCRQHHEDTLALHAGWGEHFDPQEVRNTVRRYNIDCLFFTAVETSTGMVNPVDSLTSVAEECGITVGIDAISAIASVRLDFHSEAISCITTTSGKGLASLAGVAILFVRPEQLEAPAGNRVPVSLDVLGLLKGQKSPGRVRNTLSSIQLAALDQSVEHIFERGLDSYFKHCSDLKALVLRHVERLGLEVHPGSDCPCVTTIRRTDGRSWDELNAFLSENGLEVYGNIDYMLRNDMFQIATFGDYHIGHINKLFDVLERYLQKQI